MYCPVPDDPVVLDELTVTIEGPAALTGPQVEAIVARVRSRLGECLAVLAPALAGVRVFLG